MRMKSLTVAFALMLSAACAGPVHEDCLGSSGCGYEAVATSPQDLTVSGADQMHFADGRGRCSQFASTLSVNDQQRHVQVFMLDLWVPAKAPKYKVQMRINGYRGPGEATSLSNSQLGFDPANGAIVAGDAYIVPSPDRLGTASSMSIVIAKGETSGTLELAFSDRSFAGGWRCVPWSA